MLVTTMLVTYCLICTSLHLHSIRKNQKRCIHPEPPGDGRVG